MDTPRLEIKGPLGGGDDVDNVLCVCVCDRTKLHTHTHTCMCMPAYQGRPQNCRLLTSQLLSMITDGVSPDCWMSLAS